MATIVALLAGMPCVTAIEHQPGVDHAKSSLLKAHMHSQDDIEAARV